MFLIFDSSIDSKKSGHQNFYNSNLKRCLEELSKVTEIIPFENSIRNDLGFFLKFFISFRSFLRCVKTRFLIIIPTPTSFDFIICLLLLPLIKGRVILFKRRLFNGNNFKDSIIRFALKRIANSDKFIFISDSSSIIENLSCKNDKFKISIPLRQANLLNPDDDLNFIMPKNHPTFAFAGVLREEKGIDEYEKIISMTLNHFKKSLFVIHAVCLDKVMENKLSILKDQFQLNNRVKFIERHLSDDEYSWFLNNIDVLFLPYDKEKYTSGSSGPLSEALSFKKIIICSKLDWAKDEFRNHKNIIWLNDLSEASYLKSLNAINKFDLKASEVSRNSDLSFEEDWKKVINYSINL